LVEYFIQNINTLEQGNNQFHYRNDLINNPFLEYEFTQIIVWLYLQLVAGRWLSQGLRIIEKQCCQILIIQTIEINPNNQYSFM